MDPRAAWVLNFDAESELALGPGFTASRSLVARQASLRARIGPLLAAGDLVVDLYAPVPRSAAGRRGEAWCPTPRALRALSAAGALPPDAPGFEVLRRVNSRRFCASLGQTLPRAVHAESASEVERALAAGGSPTREWLLKRAFGVTGRGRLCVAEGPLGPGARRWVDASLRTGFGLQVEPRVEREGDFALHGRVDRAGSVWLGQPTTQRLSAQGAWIASELAGSELRAQERSALEREGLEAAAALCAAGYFGPFNLDAFRYRDGEGAPRWNPRCEINARYSMGWAVGMAAARSAP